MYFKQFLHDETGCSSYFVASRETREAVVVDPQADIRPYLDLAAERHYTIRYVIDTHLHADHVSGNRALGAATGAEVCLHGAADVLFPFRALHDGEELRLGQVVLQVVHTPGHRPECVSLVMTNLERSPEPSMVLSGDTLFVGDVGRPDFGGPEGAAQQYDSVKRLLRLEDWVEVFPAHFEGSCGKAMCGRPSSTIGFERRFNPLLQLSEEAFVRSAGAPQPRPLNMDAIIAANRGEQSFPGPILPPREEQVTSVSLEAAPGWLREHEPFVLDVREPWEYEAAHLPGAVLIPQGELASRLDEVPRDRDLLVVCAGGVRSLRAAGFLAGAGFSNVASLACGTDGWVRAGLPAERAGTARAAWPPRSHESGAGQVA